MLFSHKYNELDWIAHVACSPQESGFVLTDFAVIMNTGLLGFFVESECFPGSTSVQDLTQEE